MAWFIFRIVFSASLTFVLADGQIVSNKYDPTWHSLDTRPLPNWYDDAKFGIFIHWGVFSVPSFGSEWFWRDWRESNSSSYAEYMRDNYRPGFTYQDFAPDFKAEFYNPDDWAEIFKNSGAKYVVLTSKHHEGYTLWPSKYSFSWNAMDVGPHRDLLGDLATAIRKKGGMVFGVYHSLFEWYNPLYLKDKSSGFKTQDFVKQKTIPELYELVQNYKPEVIWSDGDWEAGDTYWTSRDFLAWLYNESPVKDTVVVNDRWGKGVTCKHGDFYTCSDRYDPGVLQPHKWENCMTIDRNSWGYRRNARLKDYLTTHELIEELARTVSCGGNLLLNVGPSKDGMIPTIFEERLTDMGKWLDVNGEAIYSTKPWSVQNDTLTSGVWYTQSGDNAVQKSVYGIILKWPKSGAITLGAPKFKNTSIVTMLGVGKPLQWNASGKKVVITLPNKSQVPTNWAWVLKFSDLADSVSSWDATSSE
ncbi:alpha-L-fucosidase-like [Schistocerca serialis cubense]|uniref:alpha-L-fucosidase-like n=1 Tax=Schistocerca serialis cubense TaxID=2023355 RepID=UPI00214DF4AD|nr:alpha-L-fucosidase-like [Schistocerca serialis cubense]